MHRTFIAFVLSSAVAVTGLTAAPAHAGNDDVAKWIAGAAALAIIGAAIVDHNKNDKSQPNHGYTPGYGHGHNNQHTPYYNNDQGHAGGATVHAPKPHHYNSRALPRSCRVTKTVVGREIKAFSRHCLKRNNVDVRTMPRDCAIKLQDRETGKRRVIYAQGCLRKKGYTLARRY